MAKYIQIDVPKACHEEWNNMTPAAKGRFCDSCQKTVIDFTLMSDAQLAEFFKKRSGNVCGRFTQDQLNTNIPVPAKTIPWLKYFFQIAIPAFLFSQKTNAQTNQLKGKVHIVDVKKSWKNEKVKVDTGRILTGRVVDETGNSIPAATIKIKGTRRGVVADKNGTFNIAANSSNDTLVITALGYSLKTLNLNPENFSNLLLIKMNTSEVITLGITVVTHARKKSSPPLFSSISKPITIFPNPVPNCSKLNIKWQNKISGEQTLEIVNQTGTILQQQIINVERKTNQQTIDLKPLSAGTYIIRVTDNKTHKSQSQQFIVQ